MRKSSFKVAEGRFAGRTVHTVEFKSPREYAEAMDEIGEPALRAYCSDNWADASGQTAAQFLDDVRAGGTTRHATMIAKAKDGLAVPVFRLYGPAIGLSVGAGVPIIPAVLAGQPEYALTMTETADTTTPVRIIVDRASSAVVPAKNVERAGATIAAVAEIIQASRPVEVYAVSNMDSQLSGAGNAVSVRVRLSPHASMAEVGLYCVSLGVVRRGMYQYGNLNYKFQGWWPFDTSGFGSHGSIGSRECTRDLEAPTDILVEPLDSAHPLVKDPKAWADAALEKAFGGVETP